MMKAVVQVRRESQAAYGRKCHVYSPAETCPHFSQSETWGVTNFFKRMKHCISPLVKTDLLNDAFENQATCLQI